MQKKLILLAAGALLIAGAPYLQARDHGEGVRLAADIVNLVKTVVSPPPTVVVTAPAPVAVPVPAPAPVAVPVPAPAPVAVPVPAPAVPAFTYGYYNNVYVPAYNGWYYYGNVWCWGGRGPRPPHPPRWIPPPRRHHHYPRHYRPAPPPRHHHHHHRGRR